MFFFFKSLFKLFADKVMSWTTGKIDASSANSFGFETKLSKRSLINVKRKRTKN